MVEMIREQRRRRMEEQGLPYEEPEPEPMKIPRGLSLAETLQFAVQRRREAHIAKMRQEEEAANKTP
jgi:hypothetical protein